MAEIDKRLFEPTDNCQVSELRLGLEQQPLLCIEGCTRGIDRLKAFAVHANRFSPASNHYPGLRMPVIDIYPMAIVRFFKDAIDRNFNLDFSRVKKVESYYSIVTTRPSSLKYLQRVPHIDTASQDSLAMVHYLSDFREAGTALYRHKKTGFEYIDAERWAKYSEALSCEQANFEKLQSSGYINESNAGYEQIAAFDAKYNRLLMYRGSSLHSGLIGPDYNFDPSPDSGRLTITTFIEFW